jgi:hypothetical protein
MLDKWRVLAVLNDDDLVIDIAHLFLDGHFEVYQDRCNHVPLGQNNSF